MQRRKTPFLIASLLFVLCVSLAGPLAGQALFPVKKNKKWGLMNADGRIVQQPVYDAIGEFKQFGYAIMQREGKVGILDKEGREIVFPQYEDVKVLDSMLISVLDHAAWKVINLQGKVILEPGYERVEVLSSGSKKDGSSCLAYMVNGKWGVIDSEGNTIADVQYDEISVLENVPPQVERIYFQTRLDNLLGLLLSNGREILPPSADEIRVFNVNLIFYQREFRWGAVDALGQEVLPPVYNHFSRISENFVKLVASQKIQLLSLVYNQLVSTEPFEAFYPYSEEYVLCKKQRKLGLIDHCGNQVLSPRYDEIQPYDGELFRARLDGRWGIVTLDDLILISFEYDYIAPMKDGLCVVIQQRKMGVANFRGEVVVAPEFDRILLEEGKAKAYLREKMTLFTFNKEGHLSDENQFGHHFTIRLTREDDLRRRNSWGDFERPYQLEKFEWFYSPKQDKWGLRRLDNGEIQIEPAFNEVKVVKEVGLTLVGIEMQQEIDFDRTSYRFEMAYGLVQNDTGLLVHEVDLFDVRLSDFEKGLPVARCIFTNGKHGLVNRIGKIIKRDLAFVGDFESGLARVSIKGKSSAALKDESHHLGRLREYFSQIMAPITLTDYTQHDLNIDRFGYLTCEGCSWGYMDTLGEYIVTPQYTFVRNFMNDVGIVAQGDKWGMVDQKGKQLLPCEYDELGFLDKTGNKILRIFKKQQKYGMIDTLGQLAVSAQYDEIGHFGEGRLAVKRYGKWGFVDNNGREVVSCRFDEVGTYSEGLAAVRLGSKWGYIDKNGDVEIDFLFSKAGRFQNDLAPAKKESPRFGYINLKGEWAIEPQFIKVFEFDRGRARVVEMQGDSYRTGLIDPTGNYLVRPKYISIEEFDENGLAVVGLGGNPMRFSLINLDGQLLTTQSFRSIEAFSEGLARVRKKDGYGFINLKGELVIDADFSKASDFSEGLAAVWLDGRCGFIDRTGRVVIEPEFSRCMDFKEGKAIVFKGNQRAGLIDAQGNFFIEPGINRLIDFAEGRGLVQDEHYKFYYITEQARFYDGFYENAKEFRHGIAVVQMEGRWAIINQQGIEIIPPKYDKIEQFENGFAKVRIKGFNGLTNTQGEMIVQPDYEYISYAGEGLFRVEQGDKIGYFDMQGKWVWGLQD